MKSEIRVVGRDPESEGSWTRDWPEHMPVPNVGDSIVDASGEHWIVQRRSFLPWEPGYWMLVLYVGPKSYREPLDQGR